MDFDSIIKGCAAIVLAPVVFFAVLFVLSPVIVSCCDARDELVAKQQAERKSERQRIAEERRATFEEAARKAEEEKRLRREAKLREFAVNEATAIWKAYQDLQADIYEQNSRLVELEATLKEFGRNPSQDSDYVRIKGMLGEMEAAAKSLHVKIEDAYLAYCKFQATPSRKDYDELRRKILDDGIKEAESAAKRFDQMRTTK